MRLSAPPKRRSDDGIVPLINIVFLLLIFFLIAGTIAPKPEIDVAYPETEKSPGANAPADAVYVSADRRISYRGLPVDLGGLAAMVATVNPASQEAPLAVVVDQALPAKELSPVLATLAAAGVVRIRLITRRGGGL